MRITRAISSKDNVLSNSPHQLHKPVLIVRLRELLKNTNMKIPNKTDKTLLFRQIYIKKKWSGVCPAPLTAALQVQKRIVRSKLGKKLDRATTEFCALVFAKCCKLSMVHLHSDEKQILKGSYSYKLFRNITRLSIWERFLLKREQFCY